MTTLKQNWVLQEANSPKVDEKFFPGHFLSCFSPLYGNTIERSSRGGAKGYPFVPDELKHFNIDFTNPWELRYLTEAYKYSRPYSSVDRIELPITTVVHTTTERGFKNIGREGLLRAYPKKFHPRFMVEDVDCNFVWFSADASAAYHRRNILETMESRQEGISKSFYHEHGTKCCWGHKPDHYATSMPFTWQAKMMGGSYKSHGYELELNNLVDSYCSAVNTSSCVARRLGTMTYSAEVMFAVVIHPCEDDLNEKELAFFRQFPKMGQGPSDPAELCFYNEGAHDPGSGWIWKPFSTSSDFSRRVSTDDYYKWQLRYGRWEHPSFTFYFSNEIAGFDLDDVEYRHFVLNSMKVL